MREGDAAFEALRAAIDELAAVDAPGLLEEARAEARAKVRSILSEAIAQALLDHSNDALAGERGEGRRSEPAPRPPAEAPAEPPVAREPPPPRSGSRATKGESPGAPAPASTAASSPAEPPSWSAASPTVEPPAPSVRPPSPTAEPRATTAGGSPPTPHQHESGSGWYVYCVLDPRDLALTPGLEGVGGRPVSLVGDGELAAVASEVPLAEFGEDRLRENLNDVTWLEATALAHERVLEAALAQTTIIPMRLCTIYSGEESVREMLVRERPVFADAIARLRGRTEWGVKVFVDRNSLEDVAAERSDEIAALREEVAALPEGEAYMKRKRLDTLAAEEADLLVDECVDAVHGRLSEQAVEALLNPLQRPEASGRTSEMLLNGVYLVEDAATEAFHAAVKALEAEYGTVGFEIELTGPWPPYNFVKSSIEAAR
jgi:hypothetical protein